MDESVAAARHGAHVVVHHLGDSTRKDAEEAREAIVALQRECLLVSGDIAREETAKKVRL